MLPILASCQGPAISIETSIPLDDVLNGGVFLTGENDRSASILALLPEDDVFRLTPEMQSYLDFYIPLGADRRKKVELLMLSLGS